MAKLFRYIKLKKKKKVFRYWDSQSHRGNYKRYLKSEDWEVIRNKVLIRDKRKCCFCLSNKNLEVHHETYKNVFYEDLDDLITLCHDCHRAIHKKEK